MGTAERRHAILRVLCRRRHETLANLAAEFGVSERTIRRDIEILSLTEPLYTQPGRYGGGVYVTDGYYMDRPYMASEEITLLAKIKHLAEGRETCVLSEREMEILGHMLTTYTRPTAI